ncbi:MAG: HAD family hydrolase [Candidatus Limnocylindrales bacterium]
MTADRRRPRNEGAPLEGIGAITFDFGNTLVSVTHEAAERVVERTAARVSQRSGPFERDRFRKAWEEERARQFAEEVPAGREVDVEVRVARVLARLRGMQPPSDDDRWDDIAAAALSEPAERAAAVDAYSDAFVVEVAVPPEVGPILATLAAERPLGIVSNWPLAATIDRFVAAAGWDRHLAAIVVSQRVGAIKPQPAIFRAAEAALGVPGRRILHVGDDWAADVVGARRAGWRVAYLRDHQGSTPLPTSVRDHDLDGDLRPDLELDRLSDLPAAIR